MKTTSTAGESKEKKSCKYSALVNNILFNLTKESFQQIFLNCDLNM